MKENLCRFSIKLKFRQPIESCRRHTFILHSALCILH